MSKKHPIISITGSSGAGTTTVKDTFQKIFVREKVKAVFIEGDAFHRYGRNEMRKKVADAKAKGKNFTHFSPEANDLERLEAIFKQYAKTGTGQTRYYIHDEIEEELYKAKQGTFTDWEDFPESDFLFYEGLHGCIKSGSLDLVQYCDLKIGVVPVINLEWIQKIHRDKTSRGYSTEAVTDTILRRMHDYVHYICPQFSLTDINFQRVPIVDTSNPFITRWIPTMAECLLVIRFANPREIDFSYLLTMIHNSYMSRANSIVVPGDKQDLAMQLIFTPLINKLFLNKKRAMVN